MADYKSDGSSAEEDDDEVMDPEKDAVTSKDPSSIGKITLPDERKKPKPGRRCKFFMQGRCKRGSNCPFVHDPATVSITRTDRKVGGLSLTFWDA